MATSTARLTVLGEGLLGWAREERVTDRYGSVALLADPNLVPPDTPQLQLADAPLGARGTLIAEVLRTRRSSHIGDLARGIRPPAEPPAIGTLHELGSGTLFLATVDDLPSVGVHPDDGRAHDWLNPRILYRLHDQTVRLLFEVW